MKKKINEVQYVVSTFEKTDMNDNLYINNGGCGCFALELLKLYPKLKPMYMSDHRREQGEKILNNDYHAPSHVMLTDGVVFYDSEGIHSLNKVELKYQFINEVSKRFLQKSVSQAVNWNSCFERECVPRIADELYNIAYEFDN